jgi:hypothetical protein
MAGIAWPLSARAQERTRRIGVLQPAAASSSQFQGFLGAFLQELRRLAWTEGRNVHVDARWGFVKSLSRPGGNATGLMMFEYSLCGKRPALLKEIAPHTMRAAVLRDPAVSAGIGQFAVIQSVAGSVGLEVVPVNLSDAAELERELAAFVRSANGGLILTASALSAIHRDLIITIAARHKLPAVYQEQNFAHAGGLISYGPNFLKYHGHRRTYRPANRQTA